MIKVVVKVTVKPECVEEFKALCQDFLKKTREEEGCISTELYEGMFEPNVYSFIDEWKDMATLEAHNKSEHFNSTTPLFAAMFSADMKVDIYKKC